MEKELTIAINNYKNPELLKLCLDSIRQNVSADYELIVADSETGEETSMMMREDYPDVKFFPFRENVGFQVMLNQGYRAGSGKYFLFLNGDIIVQKGSVEKLLEFMRADEKIALVGPKLLNFNGQPQDSCFRFYKPMTIFYRRTFLGRLGFAKRHLDWFLMRDYDHQSPREVDWVMGSAMLVRRSAIEKTGMMDSRFFMYMEDVDWCRRFWDNGFKVIYFPFSQMYHYHGKGSAKGGFFRSLVSNRLTWVHISSALKYFLKHRGKPLPKHS